MSIMSKSMGNNTRIQKTITMIRKGATWEQVEEKLGCTRAYLQKLLRTSYYKTDKRYNNLLALARKNAAEAKRKEKENTVIVAETGALLRSFVPDEKSPAFVPAFCKKEISKNAEKEGADATSILENPNITWTPKIKERLECLPWKTVKPRIIGIIALCCDMARDGKKVKLYTGSRMIADLAIKQKLSIEVKIV